MSRLLETLIKWPDYLLASASDMGKCGVAAHTAQMEYSLALLSK
jgi:hypothetical protein